MVGQLCHRLQHDIGNPSNRSIPRKGAENEDARMRWWEQCPLQVIGVEDDDGHLVSTSVCKDGSVWQRTQSCIIYPGSSVPSIRNEVSTLRGTFSSSKNIRGRVIIPLPHHNIFQCIGVTLHILNLLRAQLFDCLHLFWC